MQKTPTYAQATANPTRKVTAFAGAGTIAGFMMIGLALFWPEGYERLRLYPGAEAHLATGIGLAVAWFTRERVDS